MSKSLSAMLWALAIVFAAWLASAGSINQTSAAKLMVILPLLATLQISGALGFRSCGKKKRHA